MTPDIYTCALFSSDVDVHRDIYKHIGEFGNIEDVRRLSTAASDNLSERVIMWMITPAMYNKRFSFLEELWNFCNDAQRLAFSDSFFGMLASKDIGTFQWLVAHHVAPRGSEHDESIFPLAVHSGAFYFLDAIHDICILQARSDKVVTQRDATLSVWASLYKLWRQTDANLSCVLCHNVGSCYFRKCDRDRMVDWLEKHPFDYNNSNV